LLLKSAEIAATFVPVAVRLVATAHEKSGVAELFFFRRYSSHFFHRVAFGGLNDLSLFVVFND
jgi:hypothetical protein